MTNKFLAILTVLSIIILTILCSCGAEVHEDSYEAFWSVTPVKIATQTGRQDELVENINELVGQELLEVVESCEDYCIDVEFKDVNSVTYGVTSSRYFIDRMQHSIISLDDENDMVFIHELGHALGHGFHTSEGVMQSPFEVLEYDEEEIMFLVEWLKEVYD